MPFSWRVPAHDDLLNLLVCRQKRKAGRGQGGLYFPQRTGQTGLKGAERTNARPGSGAPETVAAKSGTARVL